MNRVRKVSNTNIVTYILQVDNIWIFIPREEQLLLLPCWPSTHLWRHSVSNSTTSLTHGPSSELYLLSVIIVGSTWHLCMDVCMWCRLVKQVVEVPSCHVTTLKLAGNTLQVILEKKILNVTNFILCYNSLAWYFGDHSNHSEGGITWSGLWPLSTGGVQDPWEDGENSLCVSTGCKRHSRNG